MNVEANRIAESALPICSDIELMLPTGSNGSSASISLRTDGIKSAARAFARTTKLV